MTIALTILGFLKRLPWQLWLAIGAALALWFAYSRGYSTRDKEADAEMAAMVASVEAAQREAAAAQKAVNKAEEDRTRQLAERADYENAANQTAARAAVDRYIAANRVRSTDRSDRCAAVATASDISASVPESLPADTDVYVSDSDVRACSAAVIYAVDAHRWALSLGE